MASAREKGCGEGHSQHMCQLTATKVPLDDLKNVVRGARYICKLCGRAAAEEKNLCAPDKL